MKIFELIEKVGPVIWPLLLLSFLALSTIIERAWFWSKVLSNEREISGRVLEAARRDWSAAGEIARKHTNQPIGRFLHSALDLNEPDPDVFELALQKSADEEIAAMRRGEKILEVTIAMSPLLGLLGTVLGLIGALESVNLGTIDTDATKGVTVGISTALFSTAMGLIVAVTALGFFRLFQGLVAGQAKLFRQAGNDLEFTYRKDWLPTRQARSAYRPDPKAMEYRTMGGEGDRAQPRVEPRTESPWTVPAPQIDAIEPDR